MRVAPALSHRYCSELKVRRLDSWKDAKKGLICHVSALEEFLTRVKWDEFGDLARAVASVFGVEPSRAEANLRVGKLKSVIKVPPPYSKDEVVRKAFEAQWDYALVVERDGKYFVEPAVPYEEGFAVIEDPLKAVKEMRDFVGAPVVIVKEVPLPCCWVSAPLASCSNLLTDAGEFRSGVPLGYSLLKIPLPSEGCWEVELEEGTCEAGFPSYPAPSLPDLLRLLLVPIRYRTIKLLPRPSIGGRKW